MLASQFRVITGVDNAAFSFKVLLILFGSRILSQIISVSISVSLWIRLKEMM